MVKKSKGLKKIRSVSINSYVNSVVDEHSKKTHRCSVTNDHREIKRSEWVSKETRAVSPWLSQTFSNNKAYAATK